MTKTSNAELSFIEPTPAPEPAQAPSLDPKPAHDKEVKRCCAAWRRAYNTCTENKRGTGSGKYSPPGRVSSALRSLLGRFSSQERR